MVYDSLGLTGYLENVAYQLKKLYSKLKSDPTTKNVFSLFINLIQCFRLGLAIFAELETKGHDV